MGEHRVVALVLRHSRGHLCELNGLSIAIHHRLYRGLLAKIFLQVHAAVLGRTVIALGVAAQVRQEDHAINVDLPLRQVVEGEPQAGFRGTAYTGTFLELRNGHRTVLAPLFLLSNGVNPVLDGKTAIGLGDGRPRFPTSARPP